MTIVTQQPDGSISWVFDGELTIYTVAELKTELMPWLELNRDIELDLAQVSEVDGAGIQFLLLMRREVMASARVLRLSAISPAVRDALALCNLSHLFEDQVSLA